MQALAYVFNALVDLYIIVIIVSVVLSWLVSFNVINSRNAFVNAVQRTCWALTEPLLRPIRRVLPSMGGIDLSPILLFVGIKGVQIAMNAYLFEPMIARGL